MALDSRLLGLLLALGAALQPLPAHALNPGLPPPGQPLPWGLPGGALRVSLLGLELWQWVGLLGVVLVSVGGALLLERLFLKVGRHLAKLTAAVWDDAAVEAARGPFRLLPWAGLLALGTRLVLLPPAGQQVCDVLARTGVIVSVAWFALKLLGLIEGQLQAQVGPQGGPDAPRLRSLRTQLAVLRRVFQVATWFIAIALVLMQFETVRNVGLSLLASAGIVGVVLGLAAQKSISTLLAGIQLSITQPIRIGDTVIVEGQFGTIEDITIAYVVVRTWDLRRLVVPMTYFLDKPFENWSKGEGQLLGPVLLQVDYSADVDALRTELARILREEGAPFWDGKVGSVKVTDAADKTQTVRALVSATTPEALFELRCLVRERLIGFLRRHPSWLPTIRSQSLQVPARPDDAAGPGGLPESPEGEVPRAASLKTG